MKKVNPEDLVAGQEYYVKLKFGFKDKGLTPLCFTDILEDDYWYHKDQPIYTLDDQPQKPDPELEMLVNVANDIFCASNNPKYTVEDAAVDAYNLIAACKQIKEGER